MVKIDVKKFKEIIKQRDIKITTLSHLSGRSAQYLATLLRSATNNKKDYFEIREYTRDLMCAHLGVPTDYFTPKETVVEGAQIESSLTEKVSVDKLIETQEKLIEVQKQTNEYIRGIAADMIDVLDAVKKLKDIATDVKQLNANLTAKTWAKDSNKNGGKQVWNTGV